MLEDFFQSLIASKTQKNQSFDKINYNYNKFIYLILIEIFFLLFFLIFENYKNIE